MRKLWGAAVAAISVCLLSGCSAPTPAPTVAVTSTVTEKPTPAPTVTVTATPAAEAPAAADVASGVRAASANVTGVEQTEPGRWTIQTSLVDPGAGVSGSPAAKEAIRICQKAVELGATYVVVRDADDSSWILYGHPSYGNTCTEV